MKPIIEWLADLNTPLAKSCLRILHIKIISKKMQASYILFIKVKYHFCTKNLGVWKPF